MVVDQESVGSVGKPPGQGRPPTRGGTPQVEGQTAGGGTPQAQEEGRTGWRASQVEGRTGWTMDNTGPTDNQVVAGLELVEGSPPVDAR
jgi:hypothetical protein